MKLLGLLRVVVLLCSVYGVLNGAALSNTISSSVLGKTYDKSVYGRYVIDSSGKTWPRYSLATYEYNGDRRCSPTGNDGLEVQENFHGLLDMFPAHDENRWKPILTRNVIAFWTMLEGGKRIVEQSKFNCGKGRVKLLSSHRFLADGTIFQIKENPIRESAFERLQELELPNADWKQLPPQDILVEGDKLFMRKEQDGKMMTIVFQLQSDNTTSSAIGNDTSSSSQSSTSSTSSSSTTTN